MAGILDRLRGLITPPSPPLTGTPQDYMDHNIALGVLLWIVAEADGQFLPEEREQIEKTLLASGIPDDDLSVIMQSVKHAADKRIDMYTFTREAGGSIPYPARIDIVRNLYRVACADGHLDHEEIETIRKIAGLMNIKHKDFIDAKLQTKAEFGL